MQDDSNDKDSDLVPKQAHLPVEEVDKLLDLADRLQDRYQADFPKLYLLGIFAIGITVLYAKYFIENLSIVHPLPKGAFTVTTIIVLLLLAVFTLLATGIAQHIRTTGRSLREAIDLLREVGQAVPEQGDWSALRRAEFRIRMSRFVPVEE